MIKGLNSFLRLISAGVGMIAMLIMFGPYPAFPAEGAAQQQRLVDKATLTLEAFATDEATKESLRYTGKDARALFIIPQFMRGRSSSAGPVGAAC